MSKASFSAIVFVILFTIAIASSAFAQQKPASAPAKTAAAAPAAEPDVVLNQLQPAPTAAEMALYKQMKAKSPDDVRKFLATRKYLRQIWVACPDGKLDTDKAPTPSDDVDFGYAVDFNEQMILFSVKVAAGAKGNK